MKWFAVKDLLLALFLILTSGCTEKYAETFENPIISGSYPDPSICRVGNDYYLVNSSFEYFPGVPIFNSRDLVHWQQIGYCLTRKSQLNLDKMRSSGGIYAPTIRYDKGTFYMVTTCVDCGGNFYVTAKDPAGPWSEPVWLDNQGMDPSLFFDDDGMVYYTRHEGPGNGYIAQRTLNLETGKLEGPLKNIWRGTGDIWAEGPHLYKITRLGEGAEQTTKDANTPSRSRDGKYYLMISEGGTGYEHMVTIARSDSPWGPFDSDPDNPILTHRHRPKSPIQAVGHADIVETPDGWWLVCLAIRPQGGRFHHIGRETFLAPVEWNDKGWPVVNDNNALEFTMKAPKLPQHPWPKPPARDDFDTDKLTLQWNYLRNPYEDNYSLTQRPGYLRLYGSAVTFNDQDSPTFLGRRQADLDCTASTLLEFDPEKENEEAGLVARIYDGFHYEIGITLRDGKRQVFLRKVVRNKIIEPVKYIEVQAGPVILSIKASPLSYEFSCQSWHGLPARGSTAKPVPSEVEGIAVQPIVLGTARTKDLSVENIGFDRGMCFTGVYFGMYSSGNGSKCTTPADFDWFEYLPGKDKPGEK
jgi:alpha-N-arabinofuranosidase